MDEETQKIVMEQMKNLPSDVREAILSVDYKIKLQEITKRQRLMIDQAGKLEMETTLVVIGLEPLADFVENIQIHTCSWCVHNLDEVEAVNESKRQVVDIPNQCI